MDMDNEHPIVDVMYMELADDVYDGETAFTTVDDDVEADVPF